MAPLGNVVVEMGGGVSTEPPRDITNPQTPAPCDSPVTS